MLGMLVSSVFSRPGPSVICVVSSTGISGHSGMTMPGSGLSRGHYTLA